MSAARPAEARVSHWLSTRWRQSGRLPRLRSPREEQRDPSRARALTREADAAWVLPGATAGDLNGPEER